MLEDEAGVYGYTDETATWGIASERAIRVETFPIGYRSFEMLMGLYMSSDSDAPSSSPSPNWKLCPPSSPTRA